MADEREDRRTDTPEERVFDNDGGGGERGRGGEAEVGSSREVASESPGDDARVEEETALLSRTETAKGLSMPTTSVLGAGSIADRELPLAVGNMASNMSKLVRLREEDDEGVL